MSGIESWSMDDGASRDRVRGTKRYPDIKVCEHCGVTVAWNARSGKVRPHKRSARRSGPIEPACARDPRPESEVATATRAAQAGMKAIAEELGQLPRRRH